MVRALEEGAAIDSAERRLKVPPNSVEAEQSLIGGLMLDNEAWTKSLTSLLPPIFIARTIA